jgi:hypothetical protein
MFNLPVGLMMMSNFDDLLAFSSKLLIPLRRMALYPSIASPRTREKCSLPLAPVLGGEGWGEGPMPGNRPSP